MTLIFRILRSRLCWYFGPHLPTFVLEILLEIGFSLSLEFAVAVPSTYITQVTSKLSTCQVSLAQAARLMYPLEPLLVVPFSELARMWQNLQGSPQSKMTMEITYTFRPCMGGLSKASPINCDWKYEKATQYFHRISAQLLISFMSKSA